MLEFIAPDGFERCLQELYGPGKRSPAELERLWREYEIEIDAGCIPTLLHRHGLSRLATG